MSDCNNKLICCKPHDIITETPISARNYVAWGQNTYGQLGNDDTQKSLNLLELNKYLVVYIIQQYY